MLEKIGQSDLGHLPNLMPLYHSIWFIRFSSKLAGKGAADGNTFTRTVGLGREDCDSNAEGKA